MERGKYPLWSERERLLSYSTGVIESADHAMSLVTSPETRLELDFKPYLVCFVPKAAVEIDLQIEIAI